MKAVLIIEDDLWLAQQHQRVLRSAGFDTKIALNALDGIAMIDEELPDAIVLDVLLPGSTAFAFLNELQSYSDTGTIPVVICTNLAEDLLLANLLPYGIRQILDKSKMLPDDLITAVQKAL